jgi:hypothetical protein
MNLGLLARPVAPGRLPLSPHLQAGRRRDPRPRGDGAGGGPEERYLRSIAPASSEAPCCRHFEHEPDHDPWVETMRLLRRADQVRGKECRYCGEWFEDSGPNAAQTPPDLYDHPRLPLRDLESPSDSSATPPTSVAPPLRGPDEPRPGESTAGPAPAAPGKPPTNRLAIWSLVVNLLGVPIGSILAIVLGKRALRQIRESEGRESGRSLALAGVIWGCVAAGVTALILLIILGGNSSPIT